MTSGSAPDQRRDKEIFAAEERPAQPGNAPRGDPDLAFALLRASEDLTLTTELALRRLIDYALQSESRRVADVPDLDEATHAGPAWIAVRRLLLEKGLIRIVAGDTVPAIAIPLLERGR